MADTTPEIQSESTEPQVLNIFIAGADQSVGLTVARLASKAGHNVFGTVSKGSDGANLIRHAGGLPVYPDLSRAGEIRSAMSLSKADVVINCTAQNILGLPQGIMDYEAAADAFYAGTQALVTVAGQLGVKQLIHISPAYIYGNISAPATEASKTSRKNPVLAAAVQAEAAVLDGAIPTNVLRSGIIYGAQSVASQLVADEARKGAMFPPSKSHAAFIYEDDLAAAIVALIGVEDAPPILNISDNHPSTYKAFLAQLSAIIGVGEPSYLPPFAVNWRTTETQRAMLATNTQLDTSAIKEAIGWTPDYPTQEAGIERMLLIWRANDTNFVPEETSSVSKDIVKV